MYKRFDIICEVNKFNPYHDSKGRFASANSAASFTYSPGKSKAHDNAIAREQERTKAQMEQEAKNKKTTTDSKTTTKKPKESMHDRMLSYVKQQTNVDLDKYRDEHTRRWDKRNTIHVDWKSMPSVDRGYLMLAAQQSHAPFTLTQGSAWTMALQFKKQ